MDDVRFPKGGGAMTVPSLDDRLNLVDGLNHGRRLAVLRRWQLELGAGAGPELIDMYATWVGLEVLARTMERRGLVWGVAARRKTTAEGGLLALIAEDEFHPALDLQDVPARLAKLRSSLNKRLFAHGVFATSSDLLRWTRAASGGATISHRTPARLLTYYGIGKPRTTGAARGHLVRTGDLNFILRVTEQDGYLDVGTLPWMKGRFVLADDDQT